MAAGIRLAARSVRVWPALLATVLLLILLLGVYTLIESQRLQQNLSRELEDRAVALIGILEATSRNAIASNTLLEEAVAQRLLDNARFVDSLVARSPRAQEMLQRLTSENKLAKVELLDPQGQPVPLPLADRSSPGPWAGESPRAMMGWMMRPRGERPEQPSERRGPPGPPFMWGHWWAGPRGDPALLFPSLPRDAKIRRFWEGSAFGVAVPAQSFPGVIAVHADAEYLLNFRREIGVQRLAEDLGRQAGVAAVALLDGGLQVLASSDPAAVGRQEDDPFLREAWRGDVVKARRVARADGRDVYEVVKPFALESKQVGLIRLQLQTEGLLGVAKQTQRSILSYSLGLVGVGIAGAVAIFWMQARHLAERRELEAAVAREQRLAAVGNLAAGVAHEIRNPLNAISIGLQRLRKEFPPPDPADRAEYARFTEIMQAEIARLDTIVDRFLTLARPARLSLTEEPLAPLLEELLTLLSAQASAQQIRVVQDLRLGQARVRMDRQHLTQAFMNVLLNAIQAMPDGGTLAIRAFQETAGSPRHGETGTRGHGEVAPIRRVAASPRQVIIEVEDSGPGIAPADLDRVFEPYFTTKAGGTGLGLALAHKIFQEHGGSIRAKSDGGAGATFIITLPLLQDGP